MADLTLEELADRVEKLSGPDREVECRIWCHLQGWRWIKRIAHKHPDGRPAFFAFRCSDGDKSSTNAPRYTASIDAAMTLYIHVPEMISSCPRKVTADALRERSALLGKGPKGNGR